MKSRGNVIIVVSALAAAAAAGAAASTPYVTVYGVAEDWLAPDLAVWDVTIERSGKELGDLKRSNDEELARVVETARSLGVGEADLAIGRISVTKHFERDKHGSRKGFSHFSLARRISIEMRNLKRFDEFLTALLTDGDLDVRLAWRATAADSVTQALKVAAVRNAHAKALAMAAELDLCVGSPLIISEWPIITDVHEVDHLSREAGLIYRLQPERIRVQEKAYIRFLLVPGPPDTTFALPPR